ncbi:uncharacterized protein PV06_06566 [Exophiala oligosperma]|uniref:Apoptosis regulator Bcl-2 family BH4 domain-containing protein n=2 Tax=Chaetothyriales TaxID=34395 RepID=A0A0D2BU43_9EURO|nr:uncharacterized protein PV06_06566 [Exophiala oligosperma]KAJ9616106.1 hypothetical protein H2204_014100 [Knufia peltigerae]KIW40967.1 hypothetical protein PV06_06566 [Exophiala oligosperma]
MFSSFIPSSFPHFGFGRSKIAQAITIPSVEVHDIEVSSDKRGRRLKHLVKLNHATYSILYHSLRFHNHTPHILGSAYLFDGSADHLNNVYEDVSTHDNLEHWEDSPSEIAAHDYRDYLGQRNYQRAFVDFFEDQLVLQGYDWKSVVEKYLFDRGPKSSPNAYPMFNCLTSGLGHPLIHLGYAYELNSREIAMEALGLAATCYNPVLAKLLETKPASGRTHSTNDIFEIFERVHADKRLDHAFDGHGDDKLDHLWTDPELVSILLEHWSGWNITDPTRDFAQSQALAVALHTSVASSVGGHGYDFLLVHLLTTSHAVRILIPFFEAEHHLPLVREWFLIALSIYITQNRPPIKKENVTSYDLKGRDWGFVTHKALEGDHRYDAHFVKACRAMLEAERTWGKRDVTTTEEKEKEKETKDENSNNNYWLKGAVRFADEFSGWVFGDGEESS